MCKICEALRESFGQAVEVNLKAFSPVPEKMERALLLEGTFHPERCFATIQDDRFFGVARAKDEESNTIQLMIFEMRDLESAEEICRKLELDVQETERQEIERN